MVSIVLEFFYVNELYFPCQFRISHFTLLSIVVTFFRSIPKSSIFSLFLIFINKNPSKNIDTRALSFFHFFLVYYPRSCSCNLLRCIRQYYGGMFLLKFISYQSVRCRIERSSFSCELQTTTAPCHRHQIEHNRPYLESIRM